MLKKKKEKTMEEQLQEEVEQEKDQQKEDTRKFHEIRDQKLPQGVGFMKIQEIEGKPSDLMLNILEKVVTGNEKTENIGRMLPMDHLCKPHLESFKILAEEHIKPKFVQGKSWCLYFKSRNMKSISKDDVLKVVDQWSDGCPVSIDNPDMCIVVEVNPLFAGVGLLKEWKKYSKYNVDALQNPIKAKEHNERSTGLVKEEETKEEVKEETKEE